MKVCHLITHMIVAVARINALLSARGLHETGFERVKPGFDWHTMSER